MDSTILPAQIHLGWLGADLGVRFGRRASPVTVRKTTMAIDFYAFTKNEIRFNQSIEDALQKIDRMEQ